MNLLEWLIGLGLAGALLLGLLKGYEVFSRTLQQTHQQLQSLSELTMVEQALRQRIHQAGFTPCGVIDRLRTPTSLTGLSVSRHQIQFRYMDANYQRIRVRGDGALLLSQPLTASTDKQLLLVSDCFHAELVEVSHQSTQADQLLVWLEKPLVFSYSEPIFLGAWVSEQFTFQEQLFYQQEKSEILSRDLKTFQVSQVNAHIHIKGVTNTGIAYDWKTALWQYSDEPE